LSSADGLWILQGSHGGSEDIVKLLEHKEPIVRKKAVMALMQLHIKAPSQISHLIDKGESSVPRMRTSLANTKRVT
jgi:hypothetical protein